MGDSYWSGVAEVVVRPWVWLRGHCWVFYLWRLYLQNHTNWTFLSLPVFVYVALGCLVALMWQSPLSPHSWNV